MNKILNIIELYGLFLKCEQKISTDSRKIISNSIFFALRGDNFDGNIYCEKSIENGCAYAITDNELISNNTTIFLVEDVLKTLQDLAKHHRQQLAIPIIAITGSNGKTTHKELIHTVLSEKYRTLSTFGNLNNHIGVPLTLLSINKLHEIAIIEMGANHCNEIEFLCEIADPDYGVITNIGMAHLEGFGGVEGVKKGKSELYKYLKNKKGKIFINGDDSVLMSLSENLEKIVYGSKTEFDIHGSCNSKSEFIEFRWALKDNLIELQPLIKTKMFGQYNFMNLLCAVCVGNYFGVNTNNINSALEKYVPEMNRSQVKKTENNTIILDAYNANPSSMGLAIQNFNTQSYNYKVAIIGDMFELGDFSEIEHQKTLLQLSIANLQLILLVGNHFNNLKNNYPQFNFFENKDELIEFLKNTNITNAVILIKGSRGMQLEKIIQFIK